MLCHAICEGVYHVIHKHQSLEVANRNSRTAIPSPTISFYQARDKQVTTDTNKCIAITIHCEPLVDMIYSLHF